ncbi:MAG TPA: hypothetical protein VHT34_06985 [Clostridia bacterium]|nr:hypothetical protein [Clostridia bacterium]
MNKLIYVLILSLAICMFYGQNSIAEVLSQDTFNGLPSESYGDIAVDKSGRFVAVGAEGLVKVSKDRSNWVKIISGTTDQFIKVRWGSDRFVAIGYDEAVFMSTFDGKVKKCSILKDASFSDVLWDGKKFFIVGDRVTENKWEGIVATSYDGLKWKIVHTENKVNFISMAWNGSLYVLSGTRGEIKVSKDGINWTKPSKGLDKYFINHYPGKADYGICDTVWTGNKFVAFCEGYDNCDGNCYLAESKDGQNWSCKKTKEVMYFYKMAVNSKGCIILSFDYSDDNESITLVSFIPNGGSLEPVSFKGAEYAGGVSVINDSFYIVGDHATLFTSKDGIKWSCQKI